MLEVPLPKHADRFLLSDDGILDFCFGHKEDKPKELKASNVVVSPQFFDRFVQVSIGIVLEQLSSLERQFKWPEKIRATTAFPLIDLYFKG